MHKDLQNIHKFKHLSQSHPKKKKKVTVHQSSSQKGEGEVCEFLEIKLSEFLSQTKETAGHSQPKVLSGKPAQGKWTP